MLQPDTEIVEETVPFGPNVCLPLQLAISDAAPVRAEFVHVHCL